MKEWGFEHEDDGWLITEAGKVLKRQMGRNDCLRAVHEHNAAFEEDWDRLKALAKKAQE